jgi:peptidyl-prolyl cis-trans isomerase D
VLGSIFGIIAIALIAFILQDGIGRKNRGTGATVLGRETVMKLIKLSSEEKLDAQVQNYALSRSREERIIGLDGTKKWIVYYLRQKKIN